EEDFRYAIDRLQLQTDDMLVMIPDGVTEAQDAKQNLYGMARVLAYCSTMKPRQPSSAAAVCTGLHADVKRFIDGAAPSDDITIMAIRLATLPSAAPSV